MTSNDCLADGTPAPAKTLADREPPEAPAARRKPAGVATASAAGATIVLWASAFVGIRFAGHDFSPGALALGRMIAASLVLSLVIGSLALRARHGYRAAPARGLPRGRTLGLVIGWGVAWFGAYNVALNAAERLVDAGTAALLVATAPILVAVSAIAVLGERLTRRLGIGVAVAFLGVALIAATGFTGHVDGLGVVLAVLAALLYAAAVLLQKRLLPRVEATTMTWLGALAGTVALLPWAPELVRELAAAPTGSLLGVLYLGVFPTALGFLTWGYVISRWTAGRATAATYLIPPVTVLLSWVLLSEVPAPLALLGGALCLAGVVLATRR
ncbi:drug/metabolite transporter (DMT)-like permease [Tamaricihabitans halophyticus]|uniref:Drug/metabolite transporter (DMT)-like permease n=1 Tax=Tamaricihabitans halophyticus TaxID=1262583 RepID=A0A4R2Q3Y9_9PSEU|nr:DMT family transporter [Tamaricihabitans halophyticus]TCP43442.1 drug/metabolite transporter (DMT)-like permease [Tamaricihabitans halophyticus]